MSGEKRAAGFLARRREKRRLKRERVGDSPQKAAERKKPGDPDVKDAIARTGSVDSSPEGSETARGLV